MTSGWFYGPAFPTWSRGQNEYGAGIAGPLPMSWMTRQWILQRQIVVRHRALGMVGQLSAFQGNLPIQAKGPPIDTNITKAGDTGWIDALDPMDTGWMDALDSIATSAVAAIGS